MKLIIQMIKFLIKPLLKLQKVFFLIKFERKFSIELLQLILDQVPVPSMAMDLKKSRKSLK